MHLAEPPHEREDQPARLLAVLVELLRKRQRLLQVAGHERVREVVGAGRGVGCREALDIGRRDVHGRVKREADLLQLARQPLLARADSCHQLLRRLGVQLQSQLAGVADAPLGQLPRLRCGVFAGFPARLLDGLRQLLHRLAARDQHQHRVRRQLVQRLFERAELGGLPCAHVVDQEVAGGGVEAQHRQRVRHVGGLALAGVEALEPAGAALVLRAPPHAGAPGVDLGVVVAADEIGGLQLGHSPESTGGPSGAVRQRSVVTLMAPCVTVSVTVPSSSVR